MNRIVGYVFVSVAMVLGGVWVAAQVDLTTFQAGNLIKADDVNANFNALAGATADLQASVAGLEATQPQTFQFSISAADWDIGYHYGSGNVFHAYDIPDSALGGTNVRDFWYAGGVVHVDLAPQPSSGGYNEWKAAPHVYSYYTGTEYIGQRLEYIPTRGSIVLSQTINGWDNNSMPAEDLPDQVDVRVTLIPSQAVP